MAYRVDPNDGSIIIDGFDAGIGDSPYAALASVTGDYAGGLNDLKNVNIISTLGEASIGFATSLNSLGSFSGSIASADASGDTITYTAETGTPVSGMAIVLAGGSLPGGTSAGSQSSAADVNVYWISSINTSNKTFQLFTNPAVSSLVNISGTGTGTFASINMTAPRHWTAVTSTPSSVVNYIVDSVGRVWYQNGTNWIFTGNITRANANGNGLVYYQASDGTGYLFVYRNHLIDYMPTASIGTWTYGWQTMNTATGVANSHHSLVGQDNVVYYCDGAWLGSFFQTVAGTPFDPSNAATYTWAQKALALPFVDIAQWLTELGVSLLVAGMRNLVYPWNRTSTSFNFPIFMADTFGYASMASTQPNIPRMITINTNAYIFMGNRGRIYVTNGSQAQLYKKFPDFLAGTVEPYFTWGAVGFNKNQLYFGILSFNNAQSANNMTGGLWAIDMDTKALRLVNQLSYASYAGFCTLFIPITTQAPGSGFYAGWDSGSSTYGMDISSANLYTAGEAYVISDLIPVGTFIKKRTFSQVEFKLSAPLVSGESVQLFIGSNLTGSFTPLGTESTVGVLSSNFPVTVENMQWCKIKAVLTGTNSSPSYVRLKELRIY